LEGPSKVDYGLSSSKTGTEDTKVVIKSRKSKDRHYNGQKKRTKDRGRFCNCLKQLKKTNTHLQSPNVFLFFPFLTYVYIYNRSGFIYMYIILFYLRILTLTHIIIVFG
jgi:hypothetical protein